MPWKESTKVEERLKFVLLALEPGSNLSQLCREFGVDVKTGRKWRKRYQARGIEGLYELSRRPRVFREETPAHVICAIVKERGERGKRGALRIQRRLKRYLSQEEVPSVRTINRVLERSGLISKNRRKNKQRTKDSSLIVADCSNRVWTGDHKGWWKARNGERVEPLVIRDEWSRYLLDIAACPNTNTEHAKERFRIAFERYGLPDYIRTDNGSPFASTRGLFGLSKLSVWWMKIGIIPEFIPPGQPWKNGGHERVNRNISEDLQSDPASTRTQQQQAFDEWRVDFNFEPHSAHNEKSPASVYQPSINEYTGAEKDYDYPHHMEVRKVDQKGMVFLYNERYKFSKAFSGEQIAFEKNEDLFFRVWFCEHYLGKVALDSCSYSRGRKSSYPVRHFRWLKEAKNREDVLALK